MKCSNCDQPALFEYRLTQNKSMFYCESDLPSFLESRKKAGTLTITEEYKEAVKSAIESLSITVEATPPSVKKKTVKKTAK